MEISLGIITYKDKHNLKKLLSSVDKQILKDIKIRELIIVLTEEEKEEIKQITKNKGIKILTEERRGGKYKAVNLFLEKARSEILVLCSGDIILSEKAIESMCLPLLNNKIGIVSSQPKQLNINLNDPLGYTVYLIWRLHNIVSSLHPKYGEAIAFRNIKMQLPKTPVDEEMIAYEILKKGYLGCHSEKAVIYNKGPTNVQDYILQRRRIFCGHLIMHRKYGYTVPTMNVLLLLRAIISIKSEVNIFFFVYAFLLEAYSRLLGFFDYLRDIDYSCWKIIEK